MDDNCCSSKLARKRTKFYSSNKDLMSFASLQQRSFLSVINFQLAQNLDIVVYSSIVHVVRPRGTTLEKANKKRSQASYKGTSGDAPSMLPDFFIKKVSPKVAMIRWMYH